MKTASVAEVKARLNAYLKSSATAPVVVTRNGKAIAVLVGVEDDAALERVISSQPRKLREVLDAADRRIDEGKGLKHDEFWRQLEAASRRTEMRANGKKRRTKRSAR